MFTSSYSLKCYEKYLIEEYFDVACQYYFPSSKCLFSLWKDVYSTKGIIWNRYYCLVYMVKRFTTVTYMWSNQNVLWSFHSTVMNTVFRPVRCFTSNSVTVIYIDQQHQQIQLVERNLINVFCFQNYTNKTYWFSMKWLFFSSRIRW